ncbi:MAG: DUF4013 domain-containing protein [Coriobacteriia bacterium]|nr:DUF4013 domain-containing protein [Coriobacteriia bacterium]
MAFCPNCGSDQGESKFCGNCGTPLAAADPQPAENPQPEATPQPEASDTSGFDTPAPQPADAPVPEAAPQPADAYQGGSYSSAPQGAPEAAPFVPPVAGPGPQPSANPQPTAQPTNNQYQYQYQTPAGHTIYSPPAGKQYSAQGILAQAWKDVRTDPTIVAKSLLLGLITCVPILNWVAQGYTLRWGKTAAFRTGDALPEKVMSGKNFETGFFSFVITMVWALVLGVASLVPLVGSILQLLALPFMTLALMYFVMADNIGKGFHLGGLWKMGTRNYGGLWVILLVPSLIVSVVVGVLGALWTGVSGIDLTQLYWFLYNGSNLAAIVSSISTAGYALSPLLIYITGVASAVASFVMYRAFGYWVGRNAPEWVRESISAGADPR